MSSSYNIVFPGSIIHCMGRGLEQVVDAVYHVYIFFPLCYAECTELDLSDFGNTALEGMMELARKTVTVGLTMLACLFQVPYSRYFSLIVQGEIEQ